MRIRPLTFEDYGQVSSLLSRNGMSAQTPLQWKERKDSYPYRQHFEGVELGWVIESEEGQIVGTLENLWYLYQFNGRPLTAGVAASWVVDPEARGRSLAHGQKFYAQTNLDLLLNGSASPVTAKLMPLFKSVRIPQPDWDLSLFWVTSYTGMASAVLRRKNIKVPALKYPAAVALAARTAVKSFSVRRGSGCGITEMTEFDSNFDEWNERLAKVPNRLLQMREAAALQWRFGSALAAGKGSILLAKRNGSVAGYAIAFQQDQKKTGLKQFIIRDVQAVDDDPEVVCSLIDAVIAVSKKRGLDAVQWTGGNAAKRAAAFRLQPYTLKAPAWSFYYRVPDKQLQAEVADPSCWDMFPIDSD